MNLWLRSEGCRELAFSRRLARIAADLLQACWAACRLMLPGWGKSSEPRRVGPLTVRSYE